MHTSASNITINSPPAVANNTINLLKIVHPQQISVSTSNQPRLHPKKRKFNPADLEEIEATTSTFDRSSSDEQQQQLQQETVESTRFKVNTTPKMIVTAKPCENVVNKNSNRNSPQIRENRIVQKMYPTDTVVVQKQSFNNCNPNPHQQTTAISYNSQYLQQQEQFLHNQPLQQIAENIDLSDWCNHRVLAKQLDYYATGIIHSMDGPNSIIVEFDHPEGCQKIYGDVFENGRYDIISDASPSANDVSRFNINSYCILFQFFVCIYIDNIRMPCVHSN